MKKQIVIIVAFSAIVLAGEVEDSEQKKRGASKASGLNTIPTGSQKPDYTYNLYPQSSGPSSPSQTYQGQVPSSFYPNQASSQYFTPANNEVAAPTPTHPQIPTQPTQSQFIPINLIPNPGYQSKYQIVPQKQIGNVQLAVMQHPVMPSSIVHYPSSFFTPNTNNQLTQGLLGQGHFGFGPNFQTLTSGHFISQPSMIVLPQSHPSLYNSLVYTNPTQSLYNYPSLFQPKYSSSPSSSSDYDKAQFEPKNIIKEDGTTHNGDYLASDTNTYKHTFTSRSTYPKK